MGIFEKLKAAAPAHVVMVSAEEWHKTKHPTLNRVRPPVGSSEDLQRVISIPRRDPVDLEASTRADALVELMTARLRRERTTPCSCRGGCITRLKPAQAWALYEAPLAGGLLAPIGVGHGKTGLDILMSLVLPDCRVAVLLIPPGLREQLERDYLAWRAHFHVPTMIFDRGKTGYVELHRPVVHVIPYSKFSRADSTNLLEHIKPDVVISDEAHKLRYPDTATTARVLRYLASHPECRLCAWSGTLTAKSIKDYAHLSAFALKGASPLPLDPNVLEEWSLALDPSDWPAPGGALNQLCNEGENLQRAYHRRLVETRGVVATKAGAIDASIIITERKPPPIPEALAIELEKLRGTWVRPDGEELVDILSVARSARELACGFYYRWKFPRGEPEEHIQLWFARRKAWCKELREKLKYRREHLDSPLLCQNAAARAYQSPPYEGDLPVWKAHTYADWMAIKDTVYHESEAVWVDDFLARDAAEWALKNRGIVWYEHDAFGRRVAKLSGVPMHGGGVGAEARILAEKGDRSIIASIKAHGTGRDGLQKLFCRQLVANPPASGSAWEQLLGRTHRIGQEADEVETFVYRHTIEMSEAIDTALLQAKYIEGTMGTLQKLLAASYSFALSDGVVVTSEP